MPDTPIDATTKIDGLGAHQRRRIWSLRALGAILLFLVVFVQAQATPGTSLHELIDDFGFLLIGIAVLGRTWCALYIGGKKLNELVTDGPYSITRNPLYVFSCIGAAGIGFSTGSVVLGGVVALLVYLVLTMVTRNEESALLEKFGTPFAAYVARVPRFWPNARLWQDTRTLTVDPSKVVRTFFESGLMLISIPVLELIELLQEMHIIPVLLHLP